MNTGMMTILGNSQKMVMNPNTKQKGEDKLEGALFGSLLIEFQGMTSLTDSKEVKIEENTEKIIELIEEIETLISNLVEQGEWSGGEGLDWRETIQRAKEAASEGLFSNIISPMVQLGQRFIPEDNFSDLTVEKQNLGLAFKELTSLMTTVTGKNESSLLRLPSSFNGKETLSSSNPVNIEENLHKTWQVMRKTIQTFIEEDPSPHLSHKAGKDMKELMQKFMQLVNSLTNKENGVGQDVLERVMKKASNEEQKVFNKLIQMYQNRMEVPKTYHQQTPVTGKEVVRWVKQALGEEVQQDAKLQASKNQPLSNGSTMPMTKVEQYVIHLNQSQEASSSQKQVIHELERIIQSSRMFTNPKGNMEMLIKLKPGNLGDLTVKFAQINGEMAVKILVTSQAAKEMLEGNKTQLRHMFSPQQVVIEKVEASAVQQHLQEQMESSNKDRGQPRDHNHDYEQDEGKDPENEELSFQEILMNEKV
ncbi:flagellar hook-length control protein FliK [Halobacillus litoralis]|uniref:flagellar hook-length control protein FliK n=1 Tax=Halobacillus litoralis TaxID=45668 RepID=UPI001CFF1310|nr:flagellar hook-length control protein FliK [Halobacillus litoralis]WLR46946.1 flagellar hook-length control protein FliK [Halobacillus litoralis]